MKEDKCMKKKKVLFFCGMNILAIAILMAIVSVLPAKLVEKNLGDIFD